MGKHGMGIIIQKMSASVDTECANAGEAKAFGKPQGGKLSTKRQGQIVAATAL